MGQDSIKIREGNTGILYLNYKRGKEEKFIPKYDLDEAKDLILEFSSLTDHIGNPLKNNYWIGNTNWFPTAWANLFWRIFFNYVKYKDFIEELEKSKLTVRFVNKANFYDIYSLLFKKKKKSFIRKTIYNYLVVLNNRRILKNKTNLMFLHTMQPDNFRMTEIIGSLKKMNVDFIEVVSANRGTIFKNLFKSAYFYVGYLSLKNIFKKNYKINQNDTIKKILFASAVIEMEEMLSSFISEYELHLREVDFSKIRVLYGIDDIHIIYPILYACQQFKVPTIAHQHGAYFKRHGSYILAGITQEEYRWFDKIIVWGGYWKEKLLKISEAYAEERIVIGCNRFSQNYGSNEKSIGETKTVLIPYEFLSDTHETGRFVTRLIELGYTIFFKARPDEQINDQLEAYCLEDSIVKKIVIVTEITDELMRNISIVAGTMSTLIYELLPLNKIIWIFDTGYKQLEDLVEEGYAHKIRLGDLERLDDEFFEPALVDSNYFFAPATLEKTISRYVLNTGIREKAEVNANHESMKMG